MLTPGYNYLGKFRGGVQWYTMETNDLYQVLVSSQKRKRLIWFRLMDRVLLSDYLSKTFYPFQMTKASNNSRYKPKQKSILQTKLWKDNSFNNLPSNLQSFKQKLVSGKRFVVYR